MRQRSIVIVICCILAPPAAANADGVPERDPEAERSSAAGDEVPVSFELAPGSDEAAFYFIGQDPSPQKRATELCSSPCETRVDRGTQWIGVGPSGATYPFGTAEHTFKGPTEVRGDYDSRFGMRLAGGLVVAVLGAGGVSMTVLGILELSLPLVGAGTGTISLGQTIGLIMITRDDTIDITITPLTSRSAVGLGVRGRF